MLPGGRVACHYQHMAVNPLSDLLRLPPDDRVQIAIALWESLNDAQRDATFELSDEQRDELDYRWTEHVRNPDSAIPWSEVRRKLRG